jgi:hypothetical protein
MNDLTINPVKQSLKSYTITLRSSNPTYLAHFSFKLHFCLLNIYDYISIPNNFTRFVLVNPNEKNFEITQ